MADRIVVKAAAGSYPVVIGEGLDVGGLALEVVKPCRAVIVSDDNVFPLYGESASKSFAAAGFDVATFVVKNGEASKNLDTVSALLAFLAGEKITRTDILVALGGGVVGDITGFAAAVFLRGIGFIQIPTTLLAAVDSSVGGKTGVDLPGGKNLVGAFHRPLAVFCDVSAFASLPAGEYSCGMAEVVKHGMIADAGMLGSLAGMTAAEICRRNVEIKASVVEKDEFDTGIRNLLNFGHTVGHAVEVLSGYAVSHGSAVAVGMTVITRASERSGLTESPCLETLAAALEIAGLSGECRYGADDLARAAMSDKKRAGNVITLVIPKRPGRAELYRMPVDQLESFIAKGLEP